MKNKKNTYDVLSTGAVIVLALVTFLAGYVPRWGYLFGVVAVLTAAGSFVLYVRALSRRTASTTQAVKSESPTVSTPGLLVGESQAVRLRTARDVILRTLRETERQRHEQVHFGSLLSSGPEHEALVGSYNRYVLMQMKFHREPAHDPAVLIAGVVEKLCAATKEPRFEFILSPDGTFRIRQVSSKHSETSAASAPSISEAKEAGPGVVN